MSDERIRGLERRFKETGSAEDEAAYLLGRLRAGSLDERLTQYARDLEALREGTISPAGFRRLMHLSIEICAENPTDTYREREQDEILEFPNAGRLYTADGGVLVTGGDDKISAVYSPGTSEERTVSLEGIEGRVHDHVWVNVEGNRSYPNVFYRGIKHLVVKKFHALSAPSVFSNVANEGRALIKDVIINGFEGGENFHAIARENGFACVRDLTLIGTRDKNSIFTGAACHGGCASIKDLLMKNANTAFREAAGKGGVLYLENIRGSARWSVLEYAANNGRIKIHDLFWTGNVHVLEQIVDNGGYVELTGDIYVPGDLFYRSDHGSIRTHHTGVSELRVNPAKNSVTIAENVGLVYDTDLTENDFQVYCLNLNGTDSRIGFLNAMEFYPNAIIQQVTIEQHEHLKRIPDFDAKLDYIAQSLNTN